MPYSSEVQNLISNISAKIDRMTLDELKQVGEYAVAHGIEASGTRMKPAMEIMTRAGEKKAETEAELGYKDIAFKEEKRRFGEELGERQRQFGITTGLTREQLAEQKRQYNIRMEWQRQQWAEQKALYEQALAEQEDARKKAAKNWWQPFLGAAVGTALGAVLGPAAPAIGGAALAGAGWLSKGVGAGIGAGANYLWSGLKKGYGSATPSFSWGTTPYYETPYYYTSPQGLGFGPSGG